MAAFILGAVEQIAMYQLWSYLPALVHAQAGLPAAVAEQMQPRASGWRP
jgi:hypothetical protein